MDRRATLCTLQIAVDFYKMFCKDGGGESGGRVGTGELEGENKRGGGQRVGWVGEVLYES
jgi:hypothetical protein